nr:MAG TPA: hypothetical protein [Caudoviricetes sp.]
MLLCNYYMTHIILCQYVFVDMRHFFIVICLCMCYY